MKYSAAPGQQKQFLIGCFQGLDGQSKLSRPLHPNPSCYPILEKGMWWLFLVWVAAGTVYGIWGSRYYMKNVAYICPECHEVFQPRFKEAFWAYHTPKMRRLTCPKCGRKGLCVEVYAEREDKNNG